MDQAIMDRIEGKTCLEFKSKKSFFGFEMYEKNLIFIQFLRIIEFHIIIN